MPRVSTLLHHVAALAAFFLIAGHAYARQTTIDAATCNASGNCTAELNLASGQCIDGCVIELQPATYVMDADGFTASTLRGLRNVAIVGAGSDQTTLAYRREGFFFDIIDCVNVTFAGFSVDMLRVPFTAGTVAAYTAESHEDGMAFTLQLSPAELELYPIDAATVNRYPYLHSAPAFVGYDHEFQRFVKPVVFDTARPCATAMDAAVGIVNVTCPPGVGRGHTMAIGQGITVRHTVYNGCAIKLVNVTAMSLLDVTLFTATGMGLSAHSTRGITADRFRVRRRVVNTTQGLATRAMATVADGFHVSNPRGGTVSVTNSLFEGQGDDGINVNTRFARVTNVSTDTATATTGGTSLLQVGREVRYFWKGCRVELFDGRTMRRLLPVDIRGSVIAVGQTSITVAPALPEEAAAAALYALAVNADAIADGVLIANTTFRNNLGRGALVKQPNALIVDSTFSGMTSPGLMATIDGCYSLEGLPLSNWTARRVTVTNVGILEPFNWINLQATVAQFDAQGHPTTRCIPVETPGVFVNLSVVDSAFILDGQTNLGWLSQPAAAVSVVGAVGVTLAGNAARTVAAPGVAFRFSASNSTGVVFRGNECEVDTSG